MMAISSYISGWLIKQKLQELEVSNLSIKNKVQGCVPPNKKLSGTAHSLQVGSIICRNETWLVWHKQQPLPRSWRSIDSLIPAYI